MKFSKILLFSLLLSSNIFSQKALIVDYEVVAIENKEQKPQKEIGFWNMVTRAAKTLPEKKPKLRIEGNLSVYDVEEGMPNDAQAASMSVLATSLYNLNHNVYMDTNKGFLIEKFSAFNENFTVKDTLGRYDWKLSKERKIINNLEAFKATSSKTVINSKGTFEFPIEAWYVPELPYNTGPADFEGLPGLIVEVKVKSNIGYILRLKNIQEVTTLDITKPDEKGMVSQEVYNDEIKKLANKTKEFFEN
ncbi:GLPGLI family protein [Leeuwenhoekiella sp. LLG6367-2.1]|uniref:GLPGLI family protein n=1 Tax=Leeuwenhoekiella sp. LLG6367-2.1 TaxID=3160833 RepID=UPI0038680920